MKLYVQKIPQKADPRARREKILKEERELLGKALSERGMDPGEAFLPFLYGPGGKPYLTKSRDLYFNFSHSGSWILLAVSNGEIGADLQKKTHPEQGTLRIAKRFFHPLDIRSLEEKEDEKAREDLFFRIWTVKEAYLKYTGRGLAGGMDAFPADFAAHRIGGVPFLECPPPEEEYFVSVCGFSLEDA